MNLKFRFFKTKSNFKAYYLLPYYSFWRKEIDIGNYNVQCREFILKFKDGSISDGIVRRNEFFDMDNYLFQWQNIHETLHT